MNSCLFIYFMEVVQPRPCKRNRRYARDKKNEMKSYEKECNGDDKLIYI